MSETSAAPTVDGAEHDHAQRAMALIAAVILGLAATLTAWSAYRESLTSDLVLKNYSEQQALIALANDTFGRADQQELTERQLFLDWAVTTAQGDEVAANYLAEIMSPELFAVVDWWFTQPDTGPVSPFVEENPFLLDLPSQVLIAEGAALLEEAEAKRVAAEEADATSDRFDLANVFFAVVLFVAGLATLVQRRLIQIGFLTLSVIGLIAGTVVLVTTTGWASLN